MQNDRSLKTGTIVTVPASYRIPGCRDRRTAVVESVSANGLWLTDTTGVHHHIGDTEQAAPDGPPALSLSSRLPGWDDDELPPF